jgi:cell division protein FtsA
MEGIFETLRDPGYSAAIGLIMYGGGAFTPYEIDSNKKMRYKDEVIEPAKATKYQPVDEGEDLKLENTDEIESPKDKLARITDLDRQDKGESALVKFWHRLTQLF